MIIPLPHAKVNSFRGDFFVRTEDLRSGDAALRIGAGDVARRLPSPERAGGSPLAWRHCPTVGAGFRSVPSSFPQSDLSHTDKEPPGAHHSFIRLRGLARALLSIKPTGGKANARCRDAVRRLPLSPALRAPRYEPCPKARRRYFINFTI